MVLHSPGCGRVGRRWLYFYTTYGTSEASEHKLCVKIKSRDSPQGEFYGTLIFLSPAPNVARDFNLKQRYKNSAAFLLTDRQISAIFILNIYIYKGLVCRRFS